MGISSGSSSWETKTTFPGIDANTLVVTDSVDIGRSSLVGFFICGGDGAHNNHVATLEISPDGADWFPTEETVTGAGDRHNIPCVADYVRIRITAPEGSASLVNIVIISK